MVHSFDAHFDGTNLSPSAPAQLQIEEMGSGDISDGSTPHASAPGRLSLTPQPTAQSDSTELLMRQASDRVPQQRSRLAHQGSDAGSQTEEPAQPGTDAASQPQLSQPTLANVNNSLFRTMAGCVRHARICFYAVDAHLCRVSCIGTCRTVVVCTCCRGNSRQPAGAHPVDAAAVELQQLQAAQWELDPDKILIGERIAVGGCAEVRRARSTSHIQCHPRFGSGWMPAAPAGAGSSHTLQVSPRSSPAACGPC